MDGENNYWNALAKAMPSQMWGNALGGLGLGAFGMFGAQNPASSAMPYEQQALSQLPQYYQPYMQAGKFGLGQLQPQISNLLNNPGGTINQIGSQFHASPGFNFAMQQALQGAGHASAAGGMAGSPQQMQQNEALATNLGNQNYYNWLGQATGLYGQGLQGAEGLAGLGYGAANSLGTNLSDIYNNMAQMQYLGQANQNTQQGQGIGSLLGGAGEIGSMLGF